MPVKWTRHWTKTDFVIICQSAASLGGSWEESRRDSRYLALFISGRFSLEEANAFAIEAFDHDPAPAAAAFFQGGVDVMTFALSAKEMPLGMAYIFDNFSFIEYIDEYVFYVTKHEIEHYCESLKEAEAEDLRRLRSKRRLQRRLGLPLDPGDPCDMIKTPRPFVSDFRRPRASR